MVLQWFGRSKSASVADLIAGKQYARAIEAIKAELQKRRKDRRLRLQLADVLVLAGRKKEAVALLRALSDDLALAGNAAQAIAALKKIQAIEPGLADVEEKLAYLIEQRQRPASDPWDKRAAAGGFQEVAEIGMEEIADSPAVPAEPPPETPSAGSENPPFSDEAFREELVALVDDVLRPVPDEPEPASGAAASPLFKDLSRQELVAVIQSLRLLSFEPGEVILTEGEPGGGLFVITTGAVRAYVKSGAGHSVKIRDLGEGDFFGEISLLQGGPRTATITAASRCELLELDAAKVDAIAEKQPRVRDVIRSFYEQRKNNTLEADIRALSLH